MKLTRITAGLIAATIAGSGLVAMGATSASAATSVQTTVGVSTSAPVMTRWRCFWIGKHGRIHFGKHVRKATLKWRHGHWVIKRSWGCSKVRKWRW
ncbi:hypothetical protein ACIBG8_47095 [Nonomuraea sp. NPDC050556]|uniref:hypothetical protein n=1 Tax=Nonomuraea sp. NPDC050556 TaxID=3364369 RepID=UPI0037A8A879